MGPLLKISFKIALVTAGVIVLYQCLNLLLIYHYLKYEYFILAATLAALCAGIVLSNKYHQQNAAPSAIDNPLTKLTAKELQVLNQIAAGKSNKEIAAANYVELSTVKTHINNIYFKLCVKNRRDAAKTYQQHRLNSKSTFSPPAVI